MLHFLQVCMDDNIDIVFRISASPSINNYKITPYLYNDSSQWPVDQKVLPKPYDSGKGIRGYRTIWIYKTKIIYMGEVTVGLNAVHDNVMYKGDVTISAAK